MPSSEEKVVLPTREEATRILKSGLGHALQETAARYTVPVFWLYAEDGLPVLPDNGSAFVIDCGGEPFLVTAKHVYEGFCDAKATHPDAVCLIGEKRFALQERLIAADPAHDVATFHISREEIETLQSYGKVVLTGSQKAWPPAPPDIGRGVFFVGFPGDGRLMRPYRGSSLVEVDWCGYTALAIAASVSNTGITLVHEHDPDFDVGLRPVAPPDCALGGCSGAPLLTFVEHNGVFSWRLGGIVYESGGGLVKASRADCLNTDGSINPYPDPMAYLSPDQHD